MLRAILILSVGLLLQSCGGPPAGPEEAVRAWVAAAEVAAETRDRGALVDMISEDYTDSRGNDVSAVDKLLRFYFFRQQSVVIVSRIKDIQLHGDSAATVTVIVGMAGSSGSIASLDADAYQFELELQVEDDEWLLIGARWAPVGAQLR